MRVYLDTNILVSAIATRGLCADLLQNVLADHQLVIGEAVLAELQRVLRRKIRLTPITLTEMDTFLRRHAVIAGKAAPPSLKIRDSSDGPVLAGAVAGGADVLVTGDRDLLVVAANAPLPILAPRAFWERLRDES